MIRNNYVMKTKILSDEKISDHETISFSLKVSLQQKKINRTVTKLVNYCEEKFKNNLLSVNWNESLNLNVNEKANFVIITLKIVCSSISRRSI